MPEDAGVMELCWNSARGPRVETEKTDLTTLRDCIGLASIACQQERPENQTTIGMRDCASRETAWWDERLNQHYGQLKTMLQPDVFAALQEAQRTWIAYRDAACGFEYKFWEEGTIRSIFYSSCVLQETAERAIDLDGVLEWTDL